MFLGLGTDFGQVQGGNWPSAGAQNQNRPNAWASSGASAFASSSSGSTFPSEFFFHIYLHLLIYAHSNTFER